MFSFCQHTPAKRGRPPILERDKALQNDTVSSTSSPLFVTQPDQGEAASPSGSPGLDREDSESAEDDEGPAEKRQKRAPAVCQACQASKMDCNNATPCNYCITNGRACVYATDSRIGNSSCESAWVIDGCPL